MNYEELYGDLKELEKSLGNAVKNVGKESKNITKGTDNGDLKTIDKAIASLRDVLDDAQKALEGVNGRLAEFDRNAYVESGDFEKQLVESCKAKGIDVLRKGPGIYEMFPNKVTINQESQTVSVDKAKISSLRPAHVADQIEEIQKKLKSRSFNEATFLEELEKAYDICVLKKHSKNKRERIKSKDLYNALVPMGRLRKEYTMQMFAFDIARLHASGLHYAKDKRRLDMETSRDNTDGIRLVNQYGSEEYFLGLRFTVDEGVE